MGPGDTGRGGEFRPNGAVPCPTGWRVHLVSLGQGQGVRRWTLRAVGHRTALSFPAPFKRGCRLGLKLCHAPRNSGRKTPRALRPPCTAGPGHGGPLHASPHYDGPRGARSKCFSFRTAGLCPGGVCSRMPLLRCVWGAGCPPKLRFLPPVHGPRRAHEASLNALSCVCGVKSGRPCPSTFRGPLPAMQTCVPCTHMGHGGETPGGGNTDLKLGCFLFAGFFVGCTDPVFPCRSPRARRGPAWEFLEFALCGAFSPPG